MVPSCASRARWLSGAPAAPSALSVPSAPELEVGGDEVEVGGDEEEVGGDGVEVGGVEQGDISAWSG